MNILRSVPLLFFLVLISALLLQLMFPWWIVVFIGLAAGLISAQPPWKNFAVVFAAIGLLWFGAALYITLTESAVILPRIAGLLQLPHPWLVFAVTVIAGALPAALAALGSSWLVVRERNS